MALFIYGRTLFILEEFNMKRTVFIGLAFLLIGSVMGNAANTEKKIKIAVASNDKTAKGSVSNKAAKCPYYLIFVLYLTARGS